MKTRDSYKIIVIGAGTAGLSSTFKGKYDA
ncbi:Uncharacterised protein [Streptococcus pneumoniae]|nr:Uncharacterised protein [Streptococcus pneumoniae]